MYYGAPLGDMYWKYYQFRDAFRQEVRFASQHTDDDIPAAFCAPSRTRSSFLRKPTRSS